MNNLRFPNLIKAGMTFKLNVNLTAYPASEWLLIAYLRGTTSIDMTATAQGNLHVFNVSADITKNYKAGHYGYSLRATHTSGEVVEIDTGAIEVKTDLASVSDETDLRSHALKTLTALEAVIEGRATLDQERYRINNRELYRTPLDTLIKLRNQYRAEVANEKAKAAGKSVFGQVIRVQLR